MSFQVSKAQTIQNIIRGLLRLLWRIEITGSENVPNEGPVILVANHSGLIDGVVLLTATSRPQSVLAKHELFSSPLAFAFKGGDGIAIDWKSPDRQALHHAVQALRDNKALGIFPEGTRCRGQYDWLKDGLSYVLVNSWNEGLRPQVVPVVIAGTRLTGKSKSWFPTLRSKISVRVFSSLDLSSLNLETVNHQSRHNLDIVGERIRLMLLPLIAQAQTESGIALPDDDVSDHWERFK